MNHDNCNNNAKWYPVYAKRSRIMTSQKHVPFFNVLWWKIGLKMSGDCSNTWLFLDCEILFFAPQSWPFSCNSLIIEGSSHNRACSVHCVWGCVKLWQSRLLSAPFQLNQINSSHTQPCSKITHKYWGKQKNDTKPGAKQYQACSCTVLGQKELKGGDVTWL